MIANMLLRVRYEDKGNMIENKENIDINFYSVNLIRRNGL